ncbi:DUF3850 domain-containing protein [Brevundimonas sp.]|uniref:DUF3850 domain-containing protein n=1 Tax=Brevundimonas sp. TaxID=1871086 RepID=UPI0025BC5790|nr:DUF3850 domain-containing protein [Brevundimonas sp.]
MTTQPPVAPLYISMTPTETRLVPTLPLHFESARIAGSLRSEAERIGKGVPSDEPGFHKDLRTAAEIIDMAEQAQAFNHQMTAMLSALPPREEAPSSCVHGLYSAGSCSDCSVNGDFALSTTLRAQPQPEQGEASGEARGAVCRAEDAPVWANGIVTDGERVAMAQKAEADYGGTYWATDDGGDGSLDWKPTHFIDFEALIRPAPLAGEGKYQPRVHQWLLDCFGWEIAGDRQERGDRLLEEVLELLQSGGYDPARVAALRDYVWGRPVGEPAQEVGGVMVTLAAYCVAHDLDMMGAGETELARIVQPEIVEKIRTKQAAKPTGSALPIEVTTPARSEALDEGAAGEREPITHDVKCWPGPFDARAAGLKPWELRANDRDYRVGDILRQRRFDPERQEFTGEVDERPITWALYGPAFGLPAGQVIMTLGDEAHPSPTPATLDEGAAGEPVAWRGRDLDAFGDGAWAVCTFKPSCDVVEPLYTHPSPTPAADDDGLRVAFEAGIDVGYRDITGRDAPQAFKDKEWPKALAALKAEVK